MASAGNLRYRLFCASREAGWALRRCIPTRLLSPRINLAGAFSIGVTTYSERYEGYFKPLHRRLSRIFPEVNITVAVNGHGTAEAQAAYLHRFEREICQAAPPHQRFVLYDRAHGLTTLWNAMLAASPADRPLLILNDDLAVDGYLRRWAERFDWSGVELSLLNSSWSHFVIAPATVSRVGAFDPGFPGIGFEDMDYTARSSLAGMSIANHLCGYIHHQDHKPEATSFDDISGRVWGKYTSANQAHFAAQWESCPPEDGVYIKQLHGHVRPRRPVTTTALASIPAAAWQGSRLYPDRTV